MDLSTTSTAAADGNTSSNNIGNMRQKRCFDNISMIQQQASKKKKKAAKARKPTAVVSPPEPPTSTALQAKQQDNAVAVAPFQIDKGAIRVGSLDPVHGGYGRWNHLPCWRGECLIVLLSCCDFARPHLSLLHPLILSYSQSPTRSGPD